MVYDPRIDRDERLEGQRLLPLWADMFGEDRCNCNKNPIPQAYHELPSDGSLQLFKCGVCGHKFIEHREG